MAQYRVVCKDSSLTRRILIEASSDIAAMSQVEKQYNMMPISASLLETKTFKKRSLSRNKKLKFKDVLFIFQEIYILTSSGISLKDSLLEVKFSSEEAYVEEILDLIILGLNQGKTFSSLIAQYYQGDSLVSYVLKVGEKGGDLNKVLNVIISYLEDTDKNVSNIVKALSYPMILVVFTFMALIMLLTFVIPQFAEIFKSFGTELPIYTKVLINLSDFIQNYGLILLASLSFIVFLVLTRYKTSMSFKLKLDKFTITKIPIASKVLNLGAMFKITSSLEVLLSAGINVVESLKLTLDSVTNLHIKSKIQNVISSIENGKTLANAMRESGLLKNSTIRLIFAGENSGQTPQMLQKIVEIYRKDLNSYIQTVSKLIEPFLLIFIAIIVLFIALSIFMPIWSLSSGI